MADEIVPVVETTTPDNTETIAELERTRLALKAANKEAADRRKRLDELEKAEADRTAAAMTETDRLKAEIEAAKKQVAEANERAMQTLVRAAFVAEAAKAGAAHPEDVYLLADRSAVSVDETGKVDGVTEAVKALVDSGRIPLGRTPAPDLDGGAGGNGDRSHNSVKLTPLDLELGKKMGLSQEQIAKQKAAIAARE